MNELIAGVSLQESQSHKLGKLMKTHRHSKTSSRFSRYFYFLMMGMILSFYQKSNASCNAGWVDDAQVVQVKLYPTGPYLAIQIDKKDGCGDWYVYKYGEPGNSLDVAKAIMAMAMSAQTTSTPIGIKTTGTIFGTWGAVMTDISFNKTAGSPD